MVLVNTVLWVILAPILATASACSTRVLIDRTRSETSPSP